MTFTESVQPLSNLKLVVSLLLPVQLYQEHIWKDWLSGEEKFAFISKPFMLVDVYQNGKYTGSLNKLQFKEHLKIDLSDEREKVRIKALAYLQDISLKNTDEYNQMMYKQHISDLKTDEFVLDDEGHFPVDKATLNLL